MGHASVIWSHLPCVCLWRVLQLCLQLETLFLNASGLSPAFWWNKKGTQTRRHPASGEPHSLAAYDDQKQGQCWSSQPKKKISKNILLSSIGAS